MKPILSIIIPAYNAGEFLARAVDSVFAKGYNLDVEVIIVNDGSKDNTASVAERLCEVFQNVKLITQENQGVSAARNRGIEESAGEYVYFMDADDAVKPIFLETVLPLFSSGETDLLAFGFTHYKKGGVIHQRELNFRGKSLLEDYLKGKIRLGIWSIITKRSIIIDNNIRFDEQTYYSEDLEFMVKLLVNSSEIKTLRKPLYDYLMLSDESAMNKKGYSVKTFTTITAWVRIYDYLVKCNVSREVSKAALNRLIYYYFSQKNIYNKTKQYAHLDTLFKEYSYISKKTPPIQLSKFWVYNILKFVKTNYL